MEYKAKLIHNEYGYFLKVEGFQGTIDLGDDFRDEFEDMKLLPSLNETMSKLNKDDTQKK